MAKPYINEQRISVLKMTDPKDSNADGHDDSRDFFDKTMERVSSGLSEMFSRASNDNDAPPPKKTPVSLPKNVEAFLKAVRTNRADLVQKFLNEGVSADATDKNGDTGLMLCARAGLPQIAELLLGAGANPQKSGEKSNKTPLEEAINFGRTDIVLLLARHGGYVPGVLEGGRSLIHRACEKGKPDVVKALLDAGGDGNERTPNGSTPLIIAIQLRQNEVADALLDYFDVTTGMNVMHAETDDLRRSAFHLAVEKGNAQTVGKMLKNGALVNDPDASGETPLLRAIGQGNLALIETLAANGADLNREDCPLVFACHTPDLRSEARRGEVAALLMRHGADPDQMDAESGMAPLHAAALATSGRQAMAALLRNNANPNVYDNDGFTPLFYTLHKSTPDMMKILVNAGADINALHKEDGRTALIQAVREKRPSMVTALLECGANTKIADSHGKTALDYAKEDPESRIPDILTKTQKTTSPANKGGHSAKGPKTP